MTPLDRELYINLLYDRHLYEAAAALRSTEEWERLCEVFDAVEELLELDDSGRKTH